MLDIWMKSIAHAGGIEVPENRHIVKPAARPVAQPTPRTDGRLVKFARWVEARFAPGVEECGVLN